MAALLFDLEAAHKRYLAAMNSATFDPDSAEDQIALSRYANIEEDLRRLVRSSEKAWHLTYLMKWIKMRPGGQAFLDGLSESEPED